MAWEIEETFDSDPGWNAYKLGTHIAYNLASTSSKATSLGATTARYGGKLSGLYSKSTNLKMRWLIKNWSSAVNQFTLFGITENGAASNKPFIGVHFGVSSSNHVYLVARIYDAVGGTETVFADFLSTYKLQSDVPDPFVLEAELYNDATYGRCLRVRILTPSFGEIPGWTYGTTPQPSGTTLTGINGEAILDIGSINPGSALDCVGSGEGVTSNVANYEIDTLWANFIATGSIVTNANIVDCSVGG